MVYWIALLSSFTLLGATRYGRVSEELSELHKKSPHTTALFSLGMNDDETPLWAIRVSRTPKNVDPKKSAHLVVAALHGNELRTADFAMHFLRDLVTRFSRPAVARTWLKDTEWYVIPVMNVPGYNSGERLEHGIDPNRDFPGLCLPHLQSQLKSTRLLVDFLGRRSYTGSVAVHGYAHALTFPWGMPFPSTRTPDHYKFEKATRIAASVNDYPYGTTTDLVYPAENTFEDFAYWKHGIWSLLLELKDGSPLDIAKSSDALFSYFASLEDKPSHQNTFACNTLRSPPLDSVR